MTNTEIAAALFEALARNDAEAVRGLCAPDMQVRQNDGTPMSLESLLRFNAKVQRVISGFGYHETVRSATEAGFVEEHAVRGVAPGGKAFSFTVCVVADVRDGKVTSVREYVDTAAAADLIAALG